MNICHFVTLYLTHFARQLLLVNSHGERLMEISLANRLGVSRTPVREAIRKLELEGLVIMIPRKGAQVARITEKIFVMSSKSVLFLKNSLLFLPANELISLGFMIYVRLMRTSSVP